MPVVADEVECSNEEYCCEIDECQYETIPNIIIASIQYGQPIENVTLQIQNKTHQIKYTEFMYLNYSWSGDFIYNESKFRLETFILNNCFLTANQQSAFFLENRTVTVLHSMNSKRLHQVMNGPFIAIIEVTLWSAVLNMGMRINYKWDITSVPTKPALITCNYPHIYRIVPHHVLDCSGSDVLDCCASSSHELDC